MNDAFLFVVCLFVFLDGPCGISKTTRAKAGQRTCVSFLNLTQWKIFGRKFSLLKSVLVIDGLLLMCTTCLLMVMSIRISMFHFTDCLFNDHCSDKSFWNSTIRHTHVANLLFHLSTRLYNHIQQPSKLGFGCDYCLFKVRLLFLLNVYTFSLNLSCSRV